MALFDNQIPQSCVTSFPKIKLTGFYCLLYGIRPQRNSSYRKTSKETGQIKQ